MSRMTEHDINWGPFTIGPWTKTFSIMFESGDCESQYPLQPSLRIIGFGWAVKFTFPKWVKSWKSECDYGFSLSDMGNGYDFFQIKYGLQHWDGDKDCSWGKHLPWKQWDCVRHSLYRPDGSHFYTEEKGGWDEWYKEKQNCPALHFGFEDYDGEMIVATCLIEEREWHRGWKPFRWLKYFYKPMIRRELELSFSAEVGPQKGSWKGGTVGHGITMLANESPEAAFKRYCSMDHERKGRKFSLRYIGPCNAPEKVTP